MLPTLLIAQISDIHLGFHATDPAELNRKRLDSVMVALAREPIRPDLILVTGDLTENGTTEAYRALKAVFDAAPCPVWPLVGNHDDRAHFEAVFDGIRGEGGFVQYAFDAGPLRFVMLDTIDVGRSGGSFDAARADWLERTLAASDRPTVIALHHPPIATGNGWMTEAADAAWIERLRAVVVRHPQVVRLVAGHYHRAMLAGFAGTTLSVCPATAPQVALDFRDIDPAVADGRDMVVAESPGFALHYWNGRELVTQFGAAGEHPVLARFNARMQPAVAKTIGERAAP